VRENFDHQSALGLHPIKGVERKLLNNRVLFCIAWPTRDEEQYSGSSLSQQRIIQSEEERIQMFASIMPDI
jgi:hypothetical protein